MLTFSTLRAFHSHVVGPVRPAVVILPSHVQLVNEFGPVLLIAVVAAVVRVVAGPGRGGTGRVGSGLGVYEFGVAGIAVLQL